MSRERRRERGICDRPLAREKLPAWTRPQCFVSVEAPEFDLTLGLSDFLPSWGTFLNSGARLGMAELEESTTKSAAGSHEFSVRQRGVSEEHSSSSELRHAPGQPQRWRGQKTQTRGSCAPWSSRAAGKKRRMRWVGLDFLTAIYGTTGVSKQKQNHAHVTKHDVPLFLDDDVTWSWIMFLVYSCTVAHFSFVFILAWDFGKNRADFSGRWWSVSQLSRALAAAKPSLQSSNDLLSKMPFN